MSAIPPNTGVSPYQGITTVFQQIGDRADAAEEQYASQESADQIQEFQQKIQDAVENMKSQAQEAQNANSSTGVFAPNNIDSAVGNYRTPPVPSNLLNLQI